MLALAVAASASTHPKRFPAEYVGRWGESVEGCSPGAIHGGLTIEHRRVSDGEFSGEVRDVRRRSDGSIDVIEQWDVPEEGLTSFRSNYRLSRNRGSLILRQIALKSGETSKQTYIRCGPAR